MTIENFLSQMGIRTKQLTDRYSEYTPPMQDQHVYYAYEPSPPSHGAGATSKHSHHSGGGLKSNASMSALTLLAFLFFLHILQQCIKDHMTEMSTPPVMVMTAGREGEDDVVKSLKKIDKTGVTQNKYDDEDYKDAVNVYGEQPNNMMRINAAEHKPKIEYSRFHDDGENKKVFSGFVSAMDEK